MLQGISASLLGLFLGLFGQSSAPMEMARMLSWQESALFQLPEQPNETADAIAQQYLKNLNAKGVASDSQGIWFQSGLTTLADRQGRVPRSAASLTKIATTLASLEKWGAEHSFETLIGTNGEIEDGVLKGDLIIMGGGDPLFVWEEAIALGNTLNSLGIRKVTGDLVIVGDFSMNFKDDPARAGQMLLQGLDSRKWSGELATHHGNMRPNTPRPEIEITGTVKTKDDLSSQPERLLIRHFSLSLAEILKNMNIYSNNALSEMLAQQAGGAKVVAKLAAESASVPQDEIQLINGSGLGVDNRISPRAVVAMLMTIERKLQSQPLGIMDFFPVAGQDKKGTMLSRNIPTGTAVKTGTLREVSALAGVLPTQDQGWVWFAIINNGGWDIEYLRSQQDDLLQRFSQTWGLNPNGTQTNAEKGYLGDPTRNLTL